MAWRVPRGKTVSVWPSRRMRGEWRGAEKSICRAGPRPGYLWRRVRAMALRLLARGGYAATDAAPAAGARRLLALGERAAKSAAMRETSAAMASGAAEGDSCST